MLIFRPKLKILKNSVIISDQDPTDARNTVIVVRGLVPGGAAMLVSLIFTYTVNAKPDSEVKKTVKRYLL